MTIKELYETYGPDYEIEFSVYSCGNTFRVKLEDVPVQKIEYRNKKIIFDMEHN